MRDKKNSFEIHVLFVADVGLIIGGWCFFDLKVARLQSFVNSGE